MRCKECGGTVFLCSSTFITEYHDASIEFKGILSGKKFELVPGTVKPIGSYYPQSVKFKCSKCGKETEKIDACVNLPENILAIIEEYAGKNVFKQPD